MTDETKFGSALAQLAQIADAARLKFEGAADFLWKVPKFIEEQIKIELQKFDDYFPMSGEAAEDDFVLSMRKMRWSLESKNLFGVFPHMLSSGNLSALLSLFETYLFRVCVILESLSSRNLRHSAGSGIDRLYRFLNVISSDLSIDLDLKALKYYPEIRSASTLRNALNHASGILKLCRDPDLIENIIRNHLYLDENHRRREIISDERYTVRLIPGRYGGRIVIGPIFVWRCSFYCREFLTMLCERLCLELSQKHQTNV